MALLTIVGIVKVSAQELDLTIENSEDSQIKELTQTIAELSQRLEKLQNDYDYLDCSNYHQHLVLEAKVFDTQLKVQSNDIKAMIFNSRFDIDYYQVCEQNYNLNVDIYNIYLQHKDACSKFLSMCPFTGKKMDAINRQYNEFVLTLNSIENHLEYYKNILDLYKTMGKGYR